jgi:hypothetical protein
MAKIISEMGYIGSFGQKQQRPFEQYCIIDDDDKCRRISSINRLIVAFNRSDVLSYISLMESMTAFE